MNCKFPYTPQPRLRARLPVCRTRRSGTASSPKGSQAAERQEELYWLPEQKIHPIAIRIDLRDPYVIQNLENYGFNNRKPTRQESVQERIDQRGSAKRGSRDQVINNRGKYGAWRGGDNQDATGKRATAGALATLPSVSNQICKKTIEAKERNDGRPHMLANTKDKSVPRDNVVTRTRLTPARRQHGR